jgi:hypothetical protein
MRIFVKIASGLWVGVSTSTHWLRGILSGLAVGIVCIFVLSFVDFGFVLDLFVSKEHRQRQQEVYEMQQEQAELARTYYQRHPEEDPKFIRRDSSLNQSYTEQTSNQNGEGDNLKLTPGNIPATPSDGSK